MLSVLAQVDISASTTLIQTIARGLGLGSLYAIIALGFVLIFKATQVVNFAQGALAMAGGLFMSYLVADEHLPFTTIANPLADLGNEWATWFVNLFVALIFAALLGLVVERLAIRPMVGEPLFSLAVITLGLEIIIRVFSNDAVKVSLRNTKSPWGQDGFKIGGAFVNWSYVALVICATVCFVAVFFFYRSKLGVAMRAVSFDQEAAMAQGIKVGRVFAVAWGAGAALAALGGIFSTMPPVDATGAVQATTALVAFRALPAVILGGLDSVQGALVGGLIIGLAEVFAGQYLSQYQSTLGAGYSQIVPYLVLIIVLLVRPYGLFGTPEIRRV